MNLKMLQEFLVPYLHAIQKIRFQQDGALPHRSQEVRNFLDITFPQNCMDWSWLKFRPMACPQSGLESLRFFILGTIKNKVYKNKSRSLDELKKIEEAIEDTDSGIFQKNIIKLRQTTGKSA